jgi:pSer/pThr/pTyr-binding forkhead associated (FHA) protein
MADPSQLNPELVKISLGADSDEAKSFRRDSIVIGRAVDCDVVVKDVKASRQHCRLTRGEGIYVLEDLKSRNGTYVGGDRISETVELRANETFKVGDTVFYLI